MSLSLARLLTTTSLAAFLALPLAGRAATINVTETTDAYDGSVCTLRNAIQSINNGGDFGGCVATGGYNSNDTINLTAQTYVLSVDGTSEDNNQSGDLDIMVAMNIVGAGSGQTVISASGFSQGEEDRVLHIIQVAAGTSIFTVNLQGLTVRDGTGDEGGGGLLISVSDIDVILTDVEVTANTSGEDAGGIWNDADTRLTLIRSNVHDNTVPDDGGGIWNLGTLIMIDSVLDHNIATGDGGGLRNWGNFLAVNSTISRNITSGLQSPSGIGGGFFHDGSGKFALINTTISNNTADLAGGGIYTLGVNNAGLNDNVGFLFNTTIAQNTAGDGFGGGLCYDCIPQAVPAGQNFPVEVSNSLIAENTATTGPDCNGIIPFASGGFNLIGDDTDCSDFTATGDQTNVAAGIGPLQNNGGPTETHALLTGSLAIDRGNNTATGCQAPNVEALMDGTLILETLTEDQRHFVRPIAVLDPALPICDVGAFEFQTFDYSVTKDDGLNNLPTTTGSNFTYTITVSNVGQGDVHNVTLNDPLPAGLTFVSASPSQGTCSEAAGTVTCNLGDLAAGDSLTIGITVTATTAGTFVNVVTITNQGQTEETLSRTATETTVVIGGGLLEGSGFHCSLNPATPVNAAQGFLGFAILAAVLFAARCLRAQRR